MDFDAGKLIWTRPPEHYRITPERIEITTQPHTDLWQRTYYHFRNDNAPVLQMETKEPYFSFVVKTDFSAACHRNDLVAVRHSYLLIHGLRNRLRILFCKAA